ncbi:hypothetical protein [Paraburkholderia solisilvae]|uniref:Uncharacterized protein n=1 Tax=Paraburkholderia solisilvae TaxID=624376 RepID=A0A6J5F3D8_9BURK|nr:hypothetical protein [Paraburkholderia solisilvae]CAB3772211.1 hypothetical protein LMG29739_06217 [Paraburkholderia solisilvae]
MGDVEYEISTTGNYPDAGCQLLGDAHILKRHNRYILEDRTAAYLLTDNCKFDG